MLFGMVLVWMAASSRIASARERLAGWFKLNDTQCLLPHGADVSLSETLANGRLEVQRWSGNYGSIFSPTGTISPDGDFEFTAYVPCCESDPKLCFLDLFTREQAQRAVCTGSLQCGKQVVQCVSRCSSCALELEPAFCLPPPDGEATIDATLDIKTMLLVSRRGGGATVHAPHLQP